MSSRYPSPPSVSDDLQTLATNTLSSRAGSRISIASLAVDHQHCRQTGGGSRLWTSGADDNLNRILKSRRLEVLELCLEGSSRRFMSEVGKNQREISFASR